MVNAWVTVPAIATLDGEAKAARSKHVTIAVRKNGKVLLLVFVITINVNACQDTVVKIVNKNHAHTAVMNQMVSVTVQMENVTVPPVSVA